MTPTPADHPFWVPPEDDVLAAAGTTPLGLTTEQARTRSVGRREDSAAANQWRLLWRQFNNPIILLLLVAAILSIVLGDLVDGLIIVIITLTSALLGYRQESGAVRTVDDLLGAVRVQVEVRRDGAVVPVLIDDVVVGDVVELHAGDVVPGDGRILSADSLMVDESALTGESFPVEKQPGRLPDDAPLGTRTNSAWRGTHVASGTGVLVIASVGSDTELGRVGTHLGAGHVPTAFELGLRRFGFLLMRATALLVAGIFVANVVLDRPLIESLLFSLALAVGLTPQLLPAIVTVTLAHGARVMATRRVIVKRLDAIEDIGAIDVLCTDKTGTLTSGSIRLDAAVDPSGRPSDAVRHLAWINAAAQRSFRNPIDEAITATADGSEPAVHMIDELPYDFSRRRLTVLVRVGGTTMVVTKGAVEEVLGCCDLDQQARTAAHEQFTALSARGVRVLAVATRHVAEPPPAVLESVHESGLVLAGFLCFSDPPKPDAGAALAELAALGVSTKLVTGDNRYAAAHAAAAVGVDTAEIVTGAAMARLMDDELTAVAVRAAVFAEVEPLQKERIVRALRAGGHTVGYLGDGINDAPALRLADVGISVDSAVDIAKHTASVVLLDKDLGVLGEGIRQGRRVFANTLKYVQVTISANFGNMVSMAVAAVVLPFLPLLPRQILLLNFLSDIPGTTIAADNVDREAVSDPHGWDVARLRRFMITFGLISSAFDIATFVVLRVGFDAGAELFRTGWFLESTATELVVMLVLRTRRPWYRSRPGTALLASSLAVAAITVAIPFSPLADSLGLTAPTPSLVAALAAITVLYVAATELAKRFFDSARDRSSVPVRKRLDGPPAGTKGRLPGGDGTFDSHRSAPIGVIDEP